MLKQTSITIAILLIILIATISCNPGNPGTQGDNSNPDGISQDGNESNGNDPSGPGGEEEEISMSDMARGLSVWNSSNCTECHRLGDDPGGDSAPALTGVGDRYTIARLKAYILNPKSVNPDTKMPPQVMSDENAQYLAMFLSLNTSGVPK